MKEVDLGDAMLVAFVEGRTASPANVRMRRRIEVAGS
jgi:hypothetical protein